MNKRKGFKAGEEEVARGGEKERLMSRGERRKGDRQEGKDSDTSFTERDNIYC